MHPAGKLPKVRLCQSKTPRPLAFAFPLMRPLLMAGVCGYRGICAKVPRKFCKWAGESQSAVWRGGWPSRSCKKMPNQQPFALKGDSVMLAACLQGYKWSVIIRRNFAGGERIFIRALLPNMGPATDKHGVRKSFTKVTCWVAKTGRSRIKEFWSPTTIFLLVMMSPFLSMLRSWGAFVVVCICVLHYRVALSSMPPCFKNLRCSQPAEIPGQSPLSLAS